jgi:hypothetical protein
MRGAIRVAVEDDHHSRNQTWSRYAEEPHKVCQHRRPNGHVLLGHAPHEL